MERDFKGVWIPKEIWLDERLSALDKIIFVEVDSLDNEEGCYASNKYLAEFCQCSESKVSKAVSKLIELGYLHQESFDGRKRILKSNVAVLQGRLVKNARQDSKKCKADKQKMLANNIYNNKTNNKKENLDKSKFSKKPEPSTPNSRKTKKQQYEDKVIAKLQEYDFSEQVEDKILQFYQDRIEKGDYPADNQLTASLDTLAKETERGQLLALNNSIRNGYKGIFTSQDKGYDGIHNIGNTTPKSRIEARDKWANIVKNGEKGKDYYSF